MNNIEKLTLADRKILRRPAQDPNNSKGTMILLHGYGADEYDLMGLAPYFDANLQILSIRGSGMTPYGGASWFDIDMNVDGSLRFNAEQALESASGVIELIRLMQEQGIIPEPTVIQAGFSQGASISQLITLKQPDLIKALLIMSGRLTEQVSELITDPSALRRLAVFAGHGSHDNIIPIEFGRQIVEFWSGLVDNFDHYEYPMGHEISQAELQDIQKWFAKFL